MDTNESVSNRLSKNSNNMLNTKKESMQKKGEEENEEDHKLACAYHTISEGDILLKKNKSFELIHPLLSFEDPNSNEGHCLDKNANNNLFLIHDDTVKNIQDYIINLKEENSKIKKQNEIFKKELDSQDNNNIKLNECGEKNESSKCSQDHEHCPLCKINGSKLISLNEKF